VNNEKEKQEEMEQHDDTKTEERPFETKTENETGNEDDVDMEEQNESSMDLDGPISINVTEDTKFAAVHVTTQQIREGFAVEKPSSSSVLFPLSKRNGAMDGLGIMFPLLCEGSVTPAADEVIPNVKLIFGPPNVVISVPKHQKRLRCFLENYMPTAMNYYDGSEDCDLHKVLLAGIQLMVTGDGALLRVRDWLAQKDEVIPDSLDLAEGATISNEVLEMVTSTFGNMPSDSVRLRYFWLTFGVEGAAVAKECAGGFCLLKSVSPQARYSYVPKLLKEFIAPLLGTKIDESKTDEGKIASERTNPASATRTKSAPAARPNRTPIGHISLEGTTLANIFGDYMSFNEIKRMGSVVFKDPSLTPDVILEHLDVAFGTKLSQDAGAVGRLQRITNRHEQKRAFYQFLGVQLMPISQNIMPSALSAGATTQPAPPVTPAPASTVSARGATDWSRFFRTVVSDVDACYDQIYQLLSTGWAHSSRFFAGAAATAQMKRIIVTQFLDEFSDDSHGLLTATTMDQIIRHVFVMRSKLHDSYTSGQASGSNTSNAVHIYTGTPGTGTSARLTPAAVITTISNNAAFRSQLQAVSDARSMPAFTAACNALQPEPRAALMGQFPPNLSGTFMSVKGLISSAKNALCMVYLSFVENTFGIKLTDDQILDAIAGIFDAEASSKTTGYFKLEYLLDSTRKLDTFATADLKIMLDRLLQMLQAFWGVGPVSASFQAIRTIYNSSVFGDKDVLKLIQVTVLLPLHKKCKSFRHDPKEVLLPTLDDAVEALEKQLVVGVQDMEAQVRSINNAADIKAQSKALVLELQAAADSARKKDRSGKDSAKPKRLSSLPGDLKFEKKNVTQEVRTKVQQTFQGSKLCFTWAFVRGGCRVPNCKYDHFFKPDVTTQTLKTILPALADDFTIPASNVGQ